MVDSISNSMTHVGSFSPAKSETNSLCISKIIESFWKFISGIVHKDYYLKIRPPHPSLKISRYTVLSLQRSLLVLWLFFSDLYSHFKIIKSLSIWIYYHCSLWAIQQQKVVAHDGFSFITERKSSIIFIVATLIAEDCFHKQLFISYCCVTNWTYTC